MRNSEHQSSATVLLLLTQDIKQYYIYTYIHKDIYFWNNRICELLKQWYVNNMQIHVLSQMFLAHSRHSTHFSEDPC